MTMKQNSHSVRQPQVQAAQTGMNGIGISEVAALTPSGGGSGTGNTAGGAGSGGTSGGGPNAVPNNSFSTGDFQRERNHSLLIFS